MTLSFFRDEEREEIVPPSAYIPAIKPKGWISILSPFIFKKRASFQVVAANPIANPLMVVFFFTGVVHTTFRVYTGLAVSCAYAIFVIVKQSIASKLVFKACQIGDKILIEDSSTDRYSLLLTRIIPIKANDCPIVMNPEDRDSLNSQESIQFVVVPTR